MNGLPYYKRYARDFLDGVQGMGPELIGAYTVILDLMYARGEDFLRRDDRHLAGLMGCSIRKARALTDSLIDIKKIEFHDGFIANSRAKSELKLTRNQREACVKGGRNSKPTQQKQGVKQSHTRSRDTDTDTDKRKNTKKVPASDDALTVEKFNEFWMSYPKRKPSNPKAPAAKKFCAAIKRGINPDDIITGARSYASSLGEKAGTEFVAHAATWLNQERWTDDYSEEIDELETERRAARERLRESQRRHREELQANGVGLHESTAEAQGPDWNFD